MPRDADSSTPTTTTSMTPGPRRYPICCNSSSRRAEACSNRLKAAGLDGIGPWVLFNSHHTTDDGPVSKVKERGITSKRTGLVPRSSPSNARGWGGSADTSNQCPRKNRTCR
jgi:hypothetical protein